jgi:ketosteroid isomerase-like protein
LINISRVGHSHPVEEGDLSRYVQELLDINAIKDLVSIYPILSDAHDLDAVVETFAEDGEFLRAGAIHRGHDELRTFYGHIMTLYSMMIHTQHQHIVQLSDDGRTARGLAMGHSETVTMDGVQINGAFRYDDEYVKVGDNWKFARRVLRYQYMSTHEDMAKRLNGSERISLPGLPRRRAEIPEDLPSWQSFAESAHP